MNKQNVVVPHEAKPWRTRAWSVLPAAGALLLSASAPAAHAQVVVPNSLASVEGNIQLDTLDNSETRTYQTQIAASQLTGFAIGSEIGGISLRLDNNSAAPTTDLIFASYQVTLSQAANTIANFSATFASNIGADAATVYDGALTFAAASYSSGATGTTPNAFGPTITFSSAYVYEGGDLVITVRDSGNTQGQTPFFDATSIPAQGYGTTIVGELAPGEDATTADAFDIATVMRLNGVATAAASAPEPASLVLLALGLASGLPVFGVIVRRKDA